MAEGKKMTENLLILYLIMLFFLPLFEFLVVFALLGSEIKRIKEDVKELQNLKSINAQKNNSDEKDDCNENMKNQS